MNVPSEADDFFVDVKNCKKCKRTEIMIYHGYFFLLLFKNVSSNNYNAFFSRRITAMMKALAGYPEDMEILPVFKLKMVKAVKTLLGSNIELCKQIIESLQEERKGKREREIGKLYPRHYCLD